MLQGDAEVQDAGVTRARALASVLPDDAGTRHVAPDPDQRLEDGGRLLVMGPTGDVPHFIERPAGAAPVETTPETA